MGGKRLKSAELPDMLEIFNAPSFKITIHKSAFSGAFFLNNYVPI